MPNRCHLITALSASLVIAACSSEDIPPVGGQDSIDPTVITGSEKPTLRNLGSKDAFFDALRAALIAQHYENDYLVFPADGAADGAADGVNQEAPVALPDADNGEAAADTVSASSSNDITSTNVQEQGVDEADSVKTDGRYLYIAQREFHYDVGIPEPAPDDVGSDAESVAMARSDFVPATESTTLRIMALQPDAPDAHEIATLEVDNNGASTNGMFLHQTNDASALVFTATAYSYYDWNSPLANEPLRSTVTRVDVSNPEAAAVSHRISVDGSIITSRRIGDQLFFASRYAPTIPGVDPYSLDAEAWENIVNTTDMATVLPQFVENSTDNATALVDPAECFVARQANPEQYYHPDIISLVTVDLNTMTVSDSECFLGSSETLYASTHAVYLATTRYEHNFTDEPGIAVEPVDNPDQQSVGIDFIDPRVDTDVHQFTIGEGELSYVGSGNVQGHLGWNTQRMPFRMSEHHGRLRVVTHSAQQNSTVSPVNVTVLEPNGQGELVSIAQLPNAQHPEFIGKPGEALYASKFLGDTAYLVTFLQTDPLYVVDFSTPNDPVVAGELEIEGYSDYLQPIDEGYLLGIGKDAIPAPGGGGDGRGGLALGVKLSLFDVRDITNPREVQSIVVGQRGTESGALYDHRAITVQAANELHPTRVAFGIDVAGDVEGVRPTGEDAWHWYDFSYTGLHGFEIRTGADAGITRQGVMVVEEPYNDDYWYYSFDDRAVIINDATYYIHGSQVYAAHWSDLANKVGPR